jgi:hypothetical protein
MTAHYTSAESDAPLTCVVCNVTSEGSTYLAFIAEHAPCEHYQRGRADVVAGVRAWCAINEIAAPPLDWEGLGEYLARVTPLTDGGAS